MGGFTVEVKPIGEGHTEPRRTMRLSGEPKRLPKLWVELRLSQVDGWTVRTSSGSTHQEINWKACQTQFQTLLRDTIWKEIEEKELMNGIRRI